MEKKPENIVQFLFSQRPENNREVLVKADDRGNILEITGSKDHFSDRLEPGTSLHEIFPFLNAFFPVTGSETIDLPRLAWENLFLHFLIFKENDLYTWVLVTDETDEVAGMQEHIQRNNEFAFRHKSQFSFENPFGNLHLFQVASFIKTTEDRFIPLGALPRWAEKYFPAKSGAHKEVDLLEIFPYLSVFIPEAMAFWETAKETFLNSDMWIDIPGAGTEWHFRAYATNKNDNHYLLILFRVPNPRRWKTRGHLQFFSQYPIRARCLFHRRYPGLTHSGRRQKPIFAPPATYRPPYRKRKSECVHPLRAGLRQ